jgi:predicted polyphosphate/ATP-dependent NAD kinase
MRTVGILANPASGKDIRRIVAQAMVISNREKANIVARMLIGLHAAGVDRVLVMPDKFGIGLQAVDTLKRSMPDVTDRVEILDMEYIGAGIDTIRAVRLMLEAGAGCIITIGGDGTARLASCEIKEVPLLPVSTGTNNVLPQFIEGTVAGLAAGLVAGAGELAREKYCYRSKRLDVVVNGRVTDFALVDVAAVSGNFTGARAVWESDSLRQVAVTRASPASIGLSTIVGMLRPITTDDPFGAVVSIMPEGGRTVTAPIGPGLIKHVPVSELVLLPPDECVPVIDERPLMLALDGEREVVIRSGDQAALCLRQDGPWVVQVDQVLKHAVQEGFFLKQTGRG